MCVCVYVRVCASVSACLAESFKYFVVALIYFYFKVFFVFFLLECFLDALFIVSSGCSLVHLKREKNGTDLLSSILFC